MRMSLLLAREPFGDVLEQTLARFLFERTGVAHEVNWVEKRPFPPRTNDTQIWYANIYLNAIFTADARRDLFAPIEKEFSHSPIWWRRPAQKAYVKTALSNPFAPSLAQACLTISPPVADAQNLLIIPGNHKIRILDVANQRVIGIHKVGFPTEFMTSEIESRSLAADHGLPVPQLLAVADDKSWFEEAFVVGTPLNRLVDTALADDLFSQAKAELEMLYAQTKQTELLGDYAANLLCSINSQLLKNQSLSSDEIASIKAVADKLYQPLYAQPYTEIETVLSHGDFQPANILSANDDIWLIDWEYAMRRQIAFDALLYRTGMRQTADFSAVDQTAPTFSLFLLEELTQRLREVSNPLFRGDDVNRPIIEFLTTINTQHSPPIPA